MSMPVVSSAWWRRCVFACLIIALPGLPALARDQRLPREFVARVIHVHDGDTLWVQPEDSGQRVKLRLDGVDAPEICQSGGEASRDALARHLQDRPIQVRTRQLDRYGRPLARLRIDDEDVGAWLVREGHAWSYRYQNDAGPYVLQEFLARALGRGLFARAAEEPRDFRRRHGPCPQR
ncbi:MAG: thermonuclease family protein [Gammaproteobacteria bacterium]